MSNSEYRLQVLMSLALQARVAKAADRCRVSQGEWVRRAIQRALETPISVDPLSALAKLGAPAAAMTRILSEIAAGRRAGGQGGRARTPPTAARGRRKPRRQVLGREKRNVRQALRTTRRGRKPWARVARPGR